MSIATLFNDGEGQQAVRLPEGMRFEGVAEFEVKRQGRSLVLTPQSQPEPESAPEPECTSAPARAREPAPEPESERTPESEHLTEIEPTGECARPPLMEACEAKDRDSGVTDEDVDLFERILAHNRKYNNPYFKLSDLE